MSPTIVSRIRQISQEATTETHEVKVLMDGGGVCEIICAAKYIRPPILLDLDQVVRDNSQLCDLKHPNLIKLIDLQVLYKEVKLVMLMELIKGRALNNLLRSEGALCENVIRNFSKQICSALEYLHSQTVIHRNINSSTVMITDENQVKLIDFGFSIKLMDACSFQSSATARGLPHYMAPEVLEVTDTCDPRSVYSRESDIWAFGCVVYEMAAGEEPYADCKAILQIAKRIRDHPPPELPEHCSDALKSFHRSCMAKERKQRKLAAELLEHEFLSCMGKSAVKADVV